MTATADPGATDDVLAAQPVGYWTGVTHQAVVRRLRDTLATIDVTQPHWWTLTRVAAGEPTREDVVTQLAGVADGPDDIPRAIDQLLHRGWLGSGIDGRLQLTDAGREAQGRIKLLLTGLRAELHEGITDDEYAAALRVLRRMLGNLGAAPG
ncbi:MarR family winged helix-turn-helix transcriptional regulator [Actinoplanes friuliensis]|uniref:MarR family transcriptional regulator n=1 Tax=Actinoplanes friuliensis DSM 7358 TaxID=1246995 RepID=U5W314_9ACTN|nr:MarR family winged helix-turn-helix transcriptional regulator [Actinoplanes friuliensis]AGZ42316.1 hypothetical protein AFR_20220 [Actinoplanes friuliensis DSM 7358]